MTYTFDDDVLLELFRRVQLALFTNTDVIDNIRRMEMIAGDNGKLFLTEEYKTLTTNEVNAYIQRAHDAMQDMRPDEEMLPDVAKTLLTEEEA